MPSQKKQRPKHLGRGLASLLGPIMPEQKRPNQPVTITSIDANLPADKELGEFLRQIPLSLIKPNPYQPRFVWDQQQLEDLADSIRTNGLLQPIIVRQSGSEYEVIAGERRLRAARLIGLKTIPSLVRKATDEQLLELSLIENIHRTDLNPIERSRAYQNYIETFSLTQAEAADKLGQGRSVIANYLRLLDLPDQIKHMLIDGTLTMGHARAILALPGDQLRNKLANRALAGRLSVREIERLVRKYLTGSNKPATAAHVKPPHIIDLENKLISQLGTKVSIETRKNGQKGKIIIEFYSIDEFDRITERLGLTSLEEV